MQRYGQFLSWKPSQIAGAAIVLAIKLNLSSIAPQVGLRPLKGSNVSKMIQTFVLNSSREERFSRRSSNPFDFWTSYITELTGLSADRDFMEPYLNLMNHLDTFQFDNKMASDPTLWVTEK